MKSALVARVELGYKPWVCAQSRPGLRLGELRYAPGAGPHPAACVRHHSTAAKGTLYLPPHSGLGSLSLEATVI